MNNSFRAIAVLMSLLMAGCASIVKGTTQDVTISSDPTGAEILVDGSPVGETPTTVKIKRKSDHLVTIQKTDYQPKSVALVRDVGGAVWGNILAGGLIGWGVDAVSGAQYNLSPQTITAHLEPVEATKTVTQEPDDATVFVAKLKVLDQMKADHQLTDQEYARGRLALFKTYMPEALPPDQRTPTQIVD